MARGVGLQALVAVADHQAAGQTGVPAAVAVLHTVGLQHAGLVDVPDLGASPPPNALAGVGEDGARVVPLAVPQIREQQRA